MKVRGVRHTTRTIPRPPIAVLTSLRFKEVDHRPLPPPFVRNRPFAYKISQGLLSYIRYLAYIGFTQDNPGAER